MGYKTFEDMKHNIPDGATHYRNECESFLFTWFKETDSGIKFYEEASQNWSLIGRHVNNLKSKMVKIPSQIETPEEKEALDMIDTTSKQVESLAKGDVVEWKNGDECIYNGELYVYQCVASWDSDACILSGKSRNSHSLTDAWIEELSKPEPKEQKAERERLEAAYDLYCDWCVANEYPKFSFDRFKSSKDLDGMLVIVDKTGYRKQ